MFVYFYTCGAVIYNQKLLQTITAKFQSRGGDNRAKSEHVYFINGMLVLLLNLEKFDTLRVTCKSGARTNPILVLEEWDERLWVAILDRATVLRDGMNVFQFKSGSEIEAER